MNIINFHYIVNNKHYTNIKILKSQILNVFFFFLHQVITNVEMTRFSLYFITVVFPVRMGYFILYIHSRMIRLKLKKNRIHIIINAPVNNYRWWMQQRLSERAGQKSGELTTV